MPIYIYKHIETGEVFEVIRPIKNRKKKYTTPDGKVCVYVEVPSSIGYCGRAEKEREGFELDPGYYKRQKPKYVTLRNGRKEKYDPTRHC